MGVHRRTILRTVVSTLAGALVATPVAPRAASPAEASVKPSRFPVSDHCDGEVFFNTFHRSDKSLGTLLKWFATRDRAEWPERIENADYPAPAAPGTGRFSVTFIGHASFLVQAGGMSFLIDPVYADRVSPFSFIGPRRVRDPGQKLEALPNIDLTLVSHNHYDHLDIPTLREVQERWSPKVVTGLGNAELLGEAGMGGASELDWWHSVEIGTAKVTYTPAQHFSARGLFDRNQALWGGFVIEAAGATIYFAGDSGYCPHFGEIRERFPRIDLALLPVGAYEPRWFMQVQHMNPDEAVRAHRDLAAKRSLGMHFGTFRDLTDEAIDAPLEALNAACMAFELDDGEFTTLNFGETNEFAL